MNKKLITSVAAALAIFIPLVSQASIFGIATSGDINNLQSQLSNLSALITDLQQEVNNPSNQTILFGNATNPIGGTNYTLAGSGISAAATSITLTSLTIPQTGALLTQSMFSTNIYVTLEPGSTARQEFASCTTVTQNSNNSATLSGCTRGLLPFPPYTASSTYAFPHGGGTTLIFSNTPQFYNEFAALGNAETIFGQWTFGSSTPPRVSSDTTNAQIVASNYNLVTYGVLASTTISGSVPASTTTPGIIILATRAQLASSTATSTFGGIPYSLVPPASAFSTATSSNVVPVTNSSGTIPTPFIGQGTNDNYNFQGNVTISGNFSAAGLTTRFGGTGADGALTVSASTTINLANATTVTKNYTSISITTGTLSFTNPNASGTVIILKSQGDVTITSASIPAIDLRCIGGQGGTGGAGGGSFRGGGGAGGAGSVTPGVLGAAATGVTTNPGTTGLAFGFGLTAGQGGLNSTVSSTPGTSPQYATTTARYFVALVLPGSGGGGSAGGADGAGLPGGCGAGALYMEVGGKLNMTSGIDASGQTPTTTSAVGISTGGGGGGGTIEILYRALVAATGNASSTGGSAGANNSGNAGPLGGNAGNGYSIIAAVPFSIGQ